MCPCGLSNSSMCYFEINILRKVTACPPSPVYNSLQQIPADPSRHLVKEVVSGDTFQPVPPYRCRAHLDRRAGGLLTQRHKKKREAKLARVARVFVAHATSGIAARTHDGRGRLGVAVAWPRLRCARPQPLEHRRAHERRPRHSRLQLAKEMPGNGSKRGNARIAPVSNFGRLSEGALTIHTGV